MKLTAIKIKNFRSLKEVTISEINNFNVLIDKNNSGKSNVLSAIDAFFRILGNEALVSSNPVIGTISSDYTQRDTSAPISLSAEFHLDLSELENIRERMRHERPEIGTALEALPEDLFLQVAMSVLPPPRAYSFVERIALASLSDNSKSWSLLEVGTSAAEEIFQNYSEDQIARREYESYNNVLARFDDDDWRRLRRQGEPAYILRGVLERFASNPDIMASIRQLTEASESFAEFQTAVREKLAKLEGERRSISQRRLRVSIKTFSGIEDQIPAYVREILRSIVAVKVLYLREQRRQIGGEEAQKILNLKTRRGGSETLNRIQKIVAQLLGVRVDAFSADGRPRPGERYSGYAAELDVDDFLVELNGSGIRESLRLILDSTFEEPNILLVEEPEIHLHPGLETAMMHFLKELSARSQVFITTHSTNFLDSGDYQRIYLITKSHTTMVEPLALKEMEERIPIELGIRLSSLFMYDRLVFVEGPSDELIIRELSNVLSINLSRGNVGFITLRGIGNLSYYAAKETLEFLQKRNVQLVFLIDRDERADLEIKRVKETLGNNVVFFPTEARELENYLLVPHAIAKYINEKKGYKTEVTASKISALIEQKCEELKGYTFEAFSPSLEANIPGARRIGTLVRHEGLRRTFRADDRRNAEIS